MAKVFDLIVIGAGSGLNAIPDTGRTALIEKGPLGGTCLNRGCIPSKIILHSADVAETIKNSAKFGIKSRISKINFSQIISRANKLVSKEAKDIEKEIRKSKNITLFRGAAKFIGNKTLKVGNNTIKGKKIIIAAGSRPIIPNIPGLSKVKFLTSAEALKLKKQPKVLTIIGGGYIAAELAHFFGSLGTKINIVEMMPRLIPNEDREISEKFTEIWKRKYNVFTGYIASSFSKRGNKIFTEIKKKNGIVKKRIMSDALLMAIGVRPNSDLLDLEKTKVKTDKKGFIKTNNYLETNIKGIYALGDIAGNYMFKHSANLEAECIRNSLLGKKKKINYNAMPHAIFSSPQVAGVGFTEEQLKKEKIKYIIGRHYYIDTGMGAALQDKEGFVKILIDKKTRKILGCHILGADAPNIIHEVVVAMKNNLSADKVLNTVHIHPSLSEAIQRALQ